MKFYDSKDILKTIIFRLFISSRIWMEHSFRVGGEWGHVKIFPERFLFKFMDCVIIHSIHDSVTNYFWFLIWFTLSPQAFFSRNIREVSAYIFVIKSSCVNADELEMLFFLSLRFPNLNYKRDEIFEFSIKIYVNANWHKIYSCSARFFSGAIRWWRRRRIDFILPFSEKNRIRLAFIKNINKTRWQILFQKIIFVLDYLNILCWMLSQV